MPLTPTDEAAQILTRLFESLARRSGATLKPSTRQDIARAASYSPPLATITICSTTS
jgi:hypothetical protein